MCYAQVLYTCTYKLHRVQRESQVPHTYIPVAGVVYRPNYATVSTGMYIHVYRCLSIIKVFPRVSTNKLVNTLIANNVVYISTKLCHYSQQRFDFTRVHVCPFIADILINWYFYLFSYQATCNYVYPTY